MNYVSRQSVVVLSLLVFVTFSSSLLCSAPLKENVVVSFLDKGDVSIQSPLSKADRIRNIQSNAAVSRRRFLEQFADRFTDLRVLWIANAVALSTSKEILEEMKVHPDVRSICPDEVIQIELPSSDDTQSIKGEWILAPCQQASDGKTRCCAPSISATC